MGPDSCQVKPHSKPWMANIVIRHNHKHMCGGVLIGTRLVLTASHCVESLVKLCKGNKVNCRHWKKVSVILGDHDSGANYNRPITKGQLGTRNSLEEQEIEIKYGETDPKWNGKRTDIIRIIHIRMSTPHPAYIVLLILFLRGMGKGK